MADESIFHRPNWTSGMLLSPWHLLQQDAANAIASTWAIRHLTTQVGLVGPGLRNPAQRGHPSFDPQLSIKDDGETFRLSLTWLRAIAPDGTPVELSPTAALHPEFKRSAVQSLKTVLIHAVLTGRDEEDEKSIGVDESNPSMLAFRRPEIELRLDLPADRALRAVVIGRLRRAANTDSFEVDTTFIPVSVSMAGHSLLYNGWKRVNAEVADLAGRYAEMHRTVARFVEQLSRRGVDVRQDLDTLSFVERAVLALDACAYDTIDPSVTPQHFFSAIERASRRVALALDLSPTTRAFIEILAGTDASYGALLEEERALLAGQRSSATYDDLARWLERSQRALESLRQLLGALSGKYVDYRVNDAAASLRFLLDRNGEEFYAAVATPAHSQRDGEMLTFVFSDLALPRHEYRVVLIGDRASADFRQGDEMAVTVNVNSTMGPSVPKTRIIIAELTGQKNFAMNFEPEDNVATISGLAVTINPGSRIRNCVLFQRRRNVQVGIAASGGMGATAGPPPHVEPEPPARTSAGTPTPRHSSTTTKFTLKKPGER